MELTREATVMLRHLRSSAAASRVTQEREVRPVREANGVVEDRQLAEFDEVVAAAARAELSPRAVFHPGRDGCDVPVTVHHVVLALRLERRPHSKSGLA